MRLTPMVLFTVFVITACADHDADVKACSDEWFTYLDKSIASQNAAGRDAEVGSTEWKAVIEKHLGVRNEEALPSDDQKAWCDIINRQLKSRQTGEVVDPAN